MRDTTQKTLGANGPVALTGATGFLGRALLAELLTTTDVSIIGLVRGNSQDDANRRGHEALTSALDREPTDEETSRCSWLRADIEETRLGLSDTDWNRLATSIGDVIHCAASVRFDLDLAESHRTNVDGTARILEVANKAARQGHFGCFHHVSTAYVAGRTSERTDADYLPDDRVRNYRNNYERSKARAERMLRTQKRVPVAIYRPSIVSGRTDTGRTDNWNVLYGPMRMVTNGQLPVMPTAGRALVDTVGVDYVASGIVRIARSERCGYIGHHLTVGSEAMSVPETIEIARRIGQVFGKEPSNPELLPPARWQILTASVAMAAKAPKKTPKVRRWGRIGARGLKAFAPFAPYTCVSSIFDNRRERLMLEAAGIRMPASAIYLETICSYAIGTDFGRDPIITDLPVAA